ncbi:MAG: ABC transporter ATP-binding protein [Syntrophobacteraceae bacterium]
MTAAVIAESLNISYGNRQILRDLSFAVSEREFFIIIGPNGSGKTTLVKVISGSVKPRTGKIEIFGSSIRRTSKRALARNVALVPQYPPMDIPFTVAEVVLMGRSPHLGMLAVERRDDIEIAEQSMSFTNVRHLAECKLDKLSAGERQRVLIARAVCQRARIIVLDEPTASLDLAHQIHIMDLMERLRNEEGVTIVMVLHDLNLAAMYADRLLLLNQGIIVSIGHPSNVLNLQTLEETYGCTLLVDGNPLKKVPRVTPVPKGSFVR